MRLECKFDSPIIYSVLADWPISAVLSTSPHKQARVIRHLNASICAKRVEEACFLSLAQDDSTQRNFHTGYARAVQCLRLLPICLPLVFLRCLVTFEVSLLVRSNFLNILSP